MRIAIMQPYVFPYIGYFQLMNAVDEFVIYDNIQYTKKGWINRNRILVDGKIAYITLPLRKDSDYLSIENRYLADAWKSDRNKLLNKINESYRKAPHFESSFPTIEKAILYDEQSLFKFIFHSITLVKEYLNIQTPLIVSSTIPINHKLKGEKKIIEICSAREATIYINPSGGVDLYKKTSFNLRNIDLQFLKTDDISYPQFKSDFSPSLSILDIMMFNPIETIRKHLNHSYKLI